MSNPIPIYEHHKGVENYQISASKTIFFKANGKDECLIVDKRETNIYLSASYFIGIDWIDESTQAIYVQPKLNDNSQNTDYLAMLFSCLKHPEVAQNTEGLFEIKFEKPFIEIEQKQDLLQLYYVLFQAIHDHG